MSVHTSPDELIEAAGLDAERVDKGVEHLWSTLRGYQLRALRVRAGLSQVELARRLGVSQNRISRLERGLLERVQLDTLRRFVEAVGASLIIDVEVDGQRLPFAPYSSGLPGQPVSAHRGVVSNRSAGHFIRQ